MVIRLSAEGDGAVADLFADAARQSVRSALADVFPDPTHAVIGVELSLMTALTGPLIIATCTEFSALIITRYMEERRQGLSAREATDVASARTGLAFFTSALTTIGGFAVLIFSALPLLRDFGLIVTLNIAVALLSALVVLPPLLVWADDRGWMSIPKGGVDLDPEPGPEPVSASA